MVEAGRRQALVEAGKIVGEVALDGIRQVFVAAIAVAGRQRRRVVDEQPQALELAALGWPTDPAAAWRRILGRVRSYADLEPAFLGRVEELIDFVTVPGSR